MESEKASPPGMIIPHRLMNYPAQMITPRIKIFAWGRNNAVVINRVHFSKEEIQA